MQVKSIAAPVQARGSLPPAGPLVVSPSQDVRATYERLFAENFRRIECGLYGRTRDWELAEELTQSMFVRLWEKVAAGRVDFTVITHEFAWLWGWARTELGDYWASARAVREAVTTPEILCRCADRAEESAGDLVVAQVHTASMILAMPAPQRQVLALHVMEDLPVDEVAAHTGRSVAAVESLLADGLTRLRTAAGVNEGDVAARTEAEWERARVRKMTALASPEPANRTDRIRHRIRAAIAECVYEPGVVMPHPRVLAVVYAPADGTPWRDARSAARALEGFLSEGILTFTGRAYRVSAEGPRLARLPQVPIGQRRAIVPGLVREMLAGTWPPGTILPAASALARQWGMHVGSLYTPLAALVEAGILTRTGYGQYRVNTAAEFRAVQLQVAS